MVCVWPRSAATPVLPSPSTSRTTTSGPTLPVVADHLAQDPAITHVSMVHGETTSGILNDVAAVGKVVKAAGKIFIVDAMSYLRWGGRTGG